ncbi:response regulator transcription factor [soil metagenome]
MTLRVLIVEDHALVSQGLELMLSMHEDMDVTGAVSTAPEALERVVEDPVDVVLMDVNLGRSIGGIEATRRMKETSPRTKVLVLTMYADTETVAEAIKAGADGYLTKGSSRDALLRGIRDVADDRSVLDPSVAPGIFGRISARDPHALSDRELAVLQETSYGKSTREIAEEIGVAEETVKTYLKNIFKKLGVRDRTEAATEGLRRRLIH